MKENYIYIRKKRKETIFVVRRKMIRILHNV